MHPISTYKPSKKPMSISSITLNQTECPLAGSSHTLQKKLSPCGYYRSSSNSDTSEMMNSHHHISSPPTSPHSFDLSSSTSTHRYYRDEDDHSTSNLINDNHSIQERRQRNKAASAKYRQKKSMQHHEMCNMINRITERNNILERQLQQLAEENKKLRATADRLRSKSVAKKLLRQYMERQQHQHRLPLPILTFTQYQKDGFLPPSQSIDVMDDVDSIGSLDSLYSDDSNK